MSWIVKVGKQGKKIVNKLITPAEKHYVGYTRRIERVHTTRRICAMTFDDGPMGLPASPGRLGGRAGAGRGQRDGRSPCCFQILAIGRKRSGTGTRICRSNPTCHDITLHYPATTKSAIGIKGNLGLAVYYYIGYRYHLTLYTIP